jgi:hypothetical protein
MARTHNPVLELYPAQFNDKEFSSANHLSNALLTESEWLAPMVTHAFGSSKEFGRRNFPLSFITEGMGQVRSIQSTDLSYKIKVLGKPKKTSTVVKTSYVSTDKAGRGHTTFKIVFSDRQFHKSLSIYSPSRLECRVQTDPVQTQDGWEYTLKMMNPSGEAFIPFTDLKAGKRWGRGIAKVGKERSRGVESRSYSPFATTNQLSVVRDTYKIAGNLKNKVMVLEIKADGKVFKFWTQWELFLRQLEWKEKCETDLWYSTYNKDVNGNINVEDTDSGEVVPSGAGLLEQIPNEDQYSILTTNKLERLVTDIFFNASDADAVEVEIYTGTGGMREASRAMEMASAAFTLVDTKQIQGNAPGKLTYGAYFDTYMHRDGHKVIFKHLPMMDKGMMADVSDEHPNDTLPLESYNMYCVDNSTYDGVKNLQYVSEKGREDINFIVPGAAAVPGYDSPLFRSTDIDASSVEWMKSQGIQVMKPTNCFKLFNELTAEL